MEPTKRFANYLKNKYLITNRFVNGTNILKDHSLKVERFYNTYDYCTIANSYDGNLDFEIKLSKPRKLIYFADQLLNKKYVHYKEILHFQFIVDDKKFIEI